MKKLKMFQIVLVLIFVLFLIFLFSAKNYHKEYEINNVKIAESYNKENKAYYFTFTYKEITLDYLLDVKYRHHRGLITNLEIIEDEEKNNFCLLPKDKKLEFAPVCYENNNIVHYSNLTTDLKNRIPSKYFNKETKKTTYNDIDIYNNSYTYLIWNYDGFYYLNNSTNKKIEIFNKELYTINLVGYTDKFLVIADHDSNYTFNKFYTINLKNGNLKSHEVKENVYFDSYYIGYNKNKLYIVDNKESVMYEFNAKNGKLEKIKSKVLKNKEWENVSIKTLINKKVEFEYPTNYMYTLEQNKLYLTYKDKEIKTLISDNVKHIVKTKTKDIFYLKGDTLYHFDPYNGEERLLTYSEWNFNYENMIYIN